jgi:hypothetical protein
MKVKKISEEVAYKQITKQHTFEINGKPVRAYENQKMDNIFNDYDSDLEIDKTDKEKLTDLEYEAIGENLSELVELKDGETEEIE